MRLAGRVVIIEIRGLARLVPFPSGDASSQQQIVHTRVGNLSSSGIAAVCSSEGDLFDVTGVAFDRIL